MKSFLMASGIDKDKSDQIGGDVELAVTLLEIDGAYRIPDRKRFLISSIKDVDALPTKISAAPKSVDKVWTK